MLGEIIKFLNTLLNLIIFKIRYSIFNKHNLISFHTSKPETIINDQNPLTAIEHNRLDLNPTHRCFSAQFSSFPRRRSGKTFRFFHVVENDR